MRSLRFLLACCAVVATSLPVFADGAFPDKGLEEAVRAEVFAKRYNKEPITADDVKNISRVVGRGKGIKSLEGLQHCKQIMLIDLEDNEITDLAPLKELKLLQSITLAGNKITDLKPLQDLVKTQLLDISRNEVSDLSPLTGMQNLRDLWAARNKLTSLDPIKDLKKIWSLDVAHNQITDLAPIAGLSWLTTLDLQHNQVSSLDPLRQMKELDFLLLQHNKIADLAVLVEICKLDAEGEKRFAPYLQLYLEGNPLSEAARGAQSDQLKGSGVRLFLEDPKEAAAAK
jgi:internalin A